MEPAFYNPAEHGLTAKMWECIRRNPAFRSACKNSQSDRDFGEPDRASLSAELASLDRKGVTNVIAQILCHVEERWTLDMTWNEVPASLQHQLKIFLSPKPIIDFSSFEPGASISIPKPNAGMMIPRGTLPDITQDYRPIGIPRFIRDDKHRSILFQQLETLIPKVGRDFRALQFDGTLLGSGRAWSRYLLFVQWAKSFSDEDAANLAAYHYCSPEEFKRGDDFFSVEVAKEKLEKLKKHRNKSDVQKDVGTIRAAIDSVFPEFKPFLE